MDYGVRMINWKKYKGQRPWIVEGIKKLGYINNPNWVDGATAIHVPCGHWHKGTVKIKSYEIDELPWTGTIVTVGAGKDFETPRKAVDDTEGDVLFFVYPGVYVDPIYHYHGELNGRKLFFKGVEGYDVTVFIGQEINYSMVLRLHSNVTLMFEDIAFYGDPAKYQQHLLATNANSDINVYMNKCDLNLNQQPDIPVYYFWDAVGASPSVKSINYNIFITHCTVTGETDEKTTFLSSHILPSWDISGSSITNTLFINFYTADHSRILGNTTGSLLLSDFVHTPTFGYGVESGKYKIVEKHVDEPAVWKI